jgi:hypothetical protein
MPTIPNLPTPDEPQRPDAPLGDDPDALQAAALPIPLDDFHHLLFRAYTMSEQGISATHCLRLLSRSPRSAPVRPPP